MSRPSHLDEPQEELDPRRVRSRDRLLDAATELLVTGGLEAVTVEAVTRRSKVARTTLYRNFGNSTELVAAALQRLLPPVEPAPEEGSLRERLVELLACKSATMEQTPLHKALFAWLGSTSTAEADGTSDDDSSAVESLRARVLDHYRQPFDQILDSAEARAELGELDPTVAAAQLLGPLLFLRLTGLRPVTRAECERVVDDFLAARGPR